MLERIVAEQRVRGQRACRAEVPAGRSGRRVGGSNSVVESQPSKLLVAGSIPVSRSNIGLGGFAPADPPTASLARRFAGSLRSAGRGLWAALRAAQVSAIEVTCAVNPETFDVTLSGRGLSF